MAQDSKRDSIIEAARKRFSHFGVAKTTMNEIADDLSISKASLYYYFPDKLNLYAAVLEKIISETSDNAATFLKEKDTEAALMAYMDSRFHFINKNYNILEYLQSVTTDSRELRTVFDEVRNRQIAILDAIIRHGKERGELSVADVGKTVALFQDCLEGLHLKIRSLSHSFLPDKKEFQTLWKKEKDFALIFFRGLKVC